MMGKLICFFIGHTKAPVPRVFFRSWDNVREIGTLHCSRCGAMLGDYDRNLARSLSQ